MRLLRLVFVDPPDDCTNSTSGTTLATVVTRLMNAASLIPRNTRKCTPQSSTDAPIMIGEYGWPEAEINTTTYPVGQLIQQVLDTADSLGWTHAIYWQIYDNEAGPRGFYIKKPDGSYSLAGTKHQSIFA